MNKTSKTLTITLSALAFLVLSAGVANAASNQGFRGFHRLGELNDEQLSIFKEAKQLRINGNFEEARMLIEKSGIDFPKPKHLGEGSEMSEKHQEVEQAIEDGDYDRFIELTGDFPHKIEIDEDTFNKLVEAHALRVEGDHEGAREIMDEIGFHPRGHRFHHQEDLEE